MLYTIVAVLVLVLDQAVKFWTVNNITPQAIGDECVNLIPGVLHLTNVQNNGAAFSIMADQRWLLVGVSAVFIIAIIVLISMDIIHTKFGRWTAVLVMAGALGNCIDRVLYGYVVDMFEFELFSFAVFNVADIFITVCGILFCIHVIVYREPIEEYNAVPRKQRPEKVRPQKSRRAPEPVEDDFDELDEVYEDEYPEPEPEPEPAPRPATRGRQAKKDRPDPYANIPKRGVHRALADEIRPQNPDDPFAEWGFGGDEQEQEAPAPRTRQPAPEQEKPAPRPRRPEPVQEQRPARASQRPTPAEPEQEDDMLWSDFDTRLDDLPARHVASAPAPAPAPQKKPAPAPKKQTPDVGFEDYSLEDILSEFRDS